MVSVISLPPSCTQPDSGNFDNIRRAHGCHPNSNIITAFFYTYISGYSLGFLYLPDIEFISMNATSSSGAFFKSSNTCSVTGGFGLGGILGFFLNISNWHKYHVEYIFKTKLHICHITV